MLDAFKKHIESDLPFLKKAKLLVAFSGGIDSTVLAHLLHSLKYNISLAHCNFMLRGSESDDDENFATTFANNLKIECFTQQLETTKYAKKNKLSVQMAARELRYHWFAELRKRFQFNYLLTAHHADDNIETFFINLLRGSGLKGLSGIPEINQSVVRPLLPFSRQEIKEYALKNKLQWCEDSSNEDTKYLRNKIRHEIIPKLAEIDSDFASSILITINNLSQSQSLIDEQIAELEKKIIVAKNKNELHISIANLKKETNRNTKLFYLLQPYGFTAWNDIVDLLEAQSGKYIDAPEWRLLKDRDSLILKRKTTTNRVNITINESDKTVSTQMGTLTLEHVDQLPEVFTKNECYVDAEKLTFPLVIRHWQAGDYFYPLNGNGKKKLSKFFKDRKKTKFDKEETLLLCTSDNEIVWVINERVDHRFFDKDSTCFAKFKLILL